MAKTTQLNFQLPELFSFIKLLETEQYSPQQIELNNELILAIRDNDLSKARELLKRGADRNLKFKCARSGEFTLLALAVEQQKPEAVQLLLDKKADVNASYGIEQYTSLMRAVYLNNFKIAYTLLKNKADPNIVCKYSESAVTNSIYGVKHFLNYSRKDDNLPKLFPSLKLLNTEKYTSLELEVNNKLLNAFYNTRILLYEIRNFINQGADVNLIFDCEGSSESTLLNLAIDKQNLALVEFLLRNNANIEASCVPDQNTPLIRAIHYNNNEVAKAYSENKAELNFIGYDVNLANVAKVKLEILKLLLGHKITANNIINIIKNNDYSTYTISSLKEVFFKKEKSLPIIKKLLEYRPNIEITNEGNLTPLQIVIKYNSIEVIKILLKLGANINNISAENEQVKKLISEAEAADILFENPCADLSNYNISDSEIVISRLYFKIQKHEAECKSKEDDLYFDYEYYYLALLNNDTVPWDIQVLAGEYEEIAGKVRVNHTCKVDDEEIINFNTEIEPAGITIDTDNP